MKLSKKSWHWWLYSKFSDNWAPKDFCEYFWTVVWGLTWRTVFFTLVGGIISILLYGMFIVFLNPKHEFAPPGYIGWGFVTMFIISYIVRYIIRKRQGKPKQPNIFVEKFKAWKTKTCPRIEWED